VCVCVRACVCVCVCVLATLTLEQEALRASRVVNQDAQQLNHEIKILQKALREEQERCALLQQQIALNRASEVRHLSQLACRHASRVPTARWLFAGRWACRIVSC
jgi:hypothetical protein